MEVKNLAAVLLFSLLTAGLGLFFQKCQEKGMIFRKYRNLIRYWLWLPRRGTYLLGQGLWNEYIFRSFYRERRFHKIYKSFYKILGGCIYCNGTWICIIAFIICYGLDYKLLLLAMGGNYFWIELGIKIKQ